MSAPLLYSQPDFEAVLPRFIGLWSGFLLFVLLQQFQFTNKQKQRLLWLVVLAVCIQALFGYVQYFLLSADNPLGYNVHSNRPYGIFQQPNVMASFLATGFVLSGYLLARQKHKYNWHISDVSILYLMPILVLPLIVVLGSRTGWIGAIIGFTLLVPYLYRHSTRKRFRGWTLATLAGLALGLLMGFANSGSQNLITNKAKLEDVRSTIYSQSLDMLIEKPFTGYGLGKFESEYLIYTARQHQLNDSFAPGIPALDHPITNFYCGGSKVATADSRDLTGLTVRVKSYLYRQTRYSTGYFCSVCADFSAQPIGVPILSLADPLDHFRDTDLLGRPAYAEAKERLFQQDYENHLPSIFITDTDSCQRLYGRGPTHKLCANAV